jgi:glycosyltransferase involved in cell wall biosynthesis
MIARFDVPISPRKIRIVHVINSFQFGGAEAMLSNLLLRTDRERFEPSVAALIDDMSVAQPILDAGIPIVKMGMKPGVPDPRGLARLARYMERVQPAVVQTWMDHSNLIGGLAARMSSRARVVWGIHHSEHVEGTKRTTFMTVNACVRLSSRVPARILYCSEHAREVYEAKGFCRRRGIVVPNGFDSVKFRPDPAARLDVRRELGVGPQATLVGLLARYSPQKDHSNFLRSAAIVQRQCPGTQFLLCGKEVDTNNAALMSQIHSMGLSANCHVLGPRRDVPRIQASLDVAVSSSISEAFPLVVGEAMLCGVPCAVTDVGDSALIVGEAGLVVPRRNSEALAGAICKLIELGPDGRSQLGIRTRSRICEHFDLGDITRRYEAVYMALAAHGQRPDAAHSRVPKTFMPAAMG